MKNEVTSILSAIEQGEPQAAERLLPLVYDELRKQAARKLAQERPGQTLQATALVHEAWLRLVESEKGQHWDGRRHFFAAAAEAMRRILVDRARARLTLKRGGQGRRVEVEWERVQSRYSDVELIETHELLGDLARVDADAAEVARLHIFGGYSLEEAGSILGVSRATAYRDWAFARAWLRDAVSTRGNPGGRETFPPPIPHG
jgi:RNA polymerase sigma factor (TIGR02999 family)